MASYDLFPVHRSNLPVFTPPIDIHETKGGLMLRADLPGVTPETLELSINDNVLRIHGRMSVTPPEGSGINYQEFRVGEFYRSFILSDDLDRSGITADLENGVLSVFLPRPETEARRIPVTSRDA